MMAILAIPKENLDDTKLFGLSNFGLKISVVVLVNYLLFYLYYNFNVNDIGNMFGKTVFVEKILLNSVLLTIVFLIYSSFMILLLHNCLIVTD